MRRSPAAASRWRPPPMCAAHPWVGECSRLRSPNSSSWKRAGAAAYTRSVRFVGVGRGGKPREEQLEIRSLNNARAARGRKGKAADLGFKPSDVLRVE